MIVSGWTYCDSTWMCTLGVCRWGSLYFMNSFTFIAVTKCVTVRKIYDEITKILNSSDVHSTRAGEDYSYVSMQNTAHIAL